MLLPTTVIMLAVSAQRFLQADRLRVAQDSVHRPGAATVPPLDTQFVCGTKPLGGRLSPTARPCGSFYPPNHRKGCHSRDHGGRSHERTLMISVFKSLLLPLDAPLHHDHISPPVSCTPGGDPTLAFQILRAKQLPWPSILRKTSSPRKLALQGLGLGTLARFRIPAWFCLHRVFLCS
jgi:hypothetical protein